VTGTARAEQLLRIGRFGRRTNLSPHQLRHYHELGLLVPVLIDPESSYRYYSEAQTATAEVIAILRSVDMPLAEIRDLLRAPSRDRAQAALDRQRARLEARLAVAREKLELLEQLTMEGRLMNGQPDLVATVQVAVDAVRMHQSTGQHVMLLRESGGDRVLSIWIGPFEANGIAMWLNGMTPQRPLTYDLLATLMERLGLSVERAVIARHADDEVYYAEVHARRGEAVEVIDARPSDAINVAIRGGAPIFVASDVMDRNSKVVAAGDDAETRPALVVQVVEEGEAGPVELRRPDRMVGMIPVHELPEPGQTVPVSYSTPWMVVGVEPGREAEPPRIIVRRPKPE
jgi:bifunctional DNase/RNase